MDQAPSPEEEAITLFAAAMEAIGVPYAVTGSSALAFYGKPRFSNDVDMLVNPQPQQRRLVAQVLSEDFEADDDVIHAELVAGGSFNVFTKGADPVKVDVFTGGGAMDPAEVLARARSFVVAGQEIKVLSPEHLILSKLHWARDSHSELQLRDIQGMLGTNIDLAYVEERARKLGLWSLLEEARRL